MGKTITMKGLLVASAAVCTIVLLTLTMVLGVLGEGDTATWTGTAGVVLMAVWLVVAGGHRRVRRSAAAAVPVEPGKAAAGV
jgi:TRAP-type C4-dicarboxylate transport system permease small subunit